MNYFDSPAAKLRCLAIKWQEMINRPGAPGESDLGEAIDDVLQLADELDGTKIQGVAVSAGRKMTEADLVGRQVKMWRCEGCRMQFTQPSSYFTPSMVPHRKQYQSQDPSEAICDGPYVMVHDYSLDEKP